MGSVLFFVKRVHLGRGSFASFLVNYFSANSIMRGPVLFNSFCLICSSYILQRDELKDIRVIVPYSKAGRCENYPVWPLSSWRGRVNNQITLCKFTRPIIINVYTHIYLSNIYEMTHIFCPWKPGRSFKKLRLIVWFLCLFMDL